MPRYQLSFFGTREDLEDILRPIEASRQLEFVRTGTFEAPSSESTPSLLGARDLGVASAGETHMAATYLVVNRGSQVRFRPIEQRKGGVRYAVDQLENPESIVFRPGGTYGESTIIAGQVGTGSERSEALELYRTFEREIRRRFSKIRSFYVGRNAAELLDKGWRLTVNEKSPQLYDLQRKQME
jgi:hypothetical protein